MSAWADEAAARSMDRLWQTMHTQMGGAMVLDFTLEDTEAVLREMDGGLPCGVCGGMVCAQGLGTQMVDFGRGVKVTVERGE